MLPPGKTDTHTKSEKVDPIYLDILHYCDVLHTSCL